MRAIAPRTEESLVFWLRRREFEAWPILSLFFSEHRLPINHNHKSATQQHVSLGAVVAHTQGLMVTVATKVTHLNKEHYSPLLVVWA